MGRTVPLALAAIVVSALALGIFTHLALLPGLCKQAEEALRVAQPGGGRGASQTLSAPEALTPLPRAHIAVAVDIGGAHEHQLMFAVMLHSSWRHVVSTDDGSMANALLDLLVCCEDCATLPVECLPAEVAPGRLRPPLPQHRCLYARNRDPDLAYFKKMKHPAMLSVSFLAAEPFRALLLRYDYILRSDQDAMVTPRILSWRPPHGVVFGWNGDTPEWTKARLENISKQLGWKHRGVHDMCSGWYMPPKLAIELAEFTVRAAKHLLEEEFGYREDTGYMAPRVKLGGLEWWKEDNQEGEWPRWWRQITSLYASDLAINHVVPSVGQHLVTDDIDWSTVLGDSVWRHVHLHAKQMADLGMGFSKFRFFDEILQSGGASTRNMSVRAALGHYMALNRQLQDTHNMTAIYEDSSIYVTWIASKGVAYAASVFPHSSEGRQGQQDWLRLVARTEGALAD